LRSEASSDVAIISMAVRLPGANNLEEFWQNLCGGVESIAFFNDEDCLEAGVDPELLAHPDYVRAEAISDDVEMFDAAFFGIAPREAELIDPQQRFLLELGWEVLQRAGYGAESDRGSVGVFSGAALSSYMFNNLVQFQAVNIMTSFQTRVMLFAGNDKDFHAQKRLLRTPPPIWCPTFLKSEKLDRHLRRRRVSGGGL
ncbi:MAG: hypothetical protein GY856_33735, partial [bacterium]|nr:hypothetical protein [bacterium]